MTLHTELFVMFQVMPMITNLKEITSNCTYDSDTQFHLSKYLVGFRTIIIIITVYGMNVK